jgi:hypothetical protein
MDAAIKQVAEEIVVFFDPEGNPFSNDPRWADSRIQEAWAVRNQGNPNPATEEDDSEEVEEVDEPYDKWTNEELRTELATRGLSVDGKKTDLVQRLEANDKKNAG